MRPAARQSTSSYQSNSGAASQPSSRNTLRRKWERDVRRFDIAATTVVPLLGGRPTGRCPAGRRKSTHDSRDNRPSNDGIQSTMGDRRRSRRSGARPLWAPFFGQIRARVALAHLVQASSSHDQSAQLGREFFEKCPLETTTDHTTSSTSGPRNCAASLSTRILLPLCPTTNRTIRPALSTPGKHWSILRRRITRRTKCTRTSPSKEVLPSSSMRTSPSSPTGCGKPGAVRMDQRKKTGSMPPRNCRAAHRLFRNSDCRQERNP